MNIGIKLLLCMTLASAFSTTTSHSLSAQETVPENSPTLSREEKSVGESLEEGANDASKTVKEMTDSIQENAEDIARKVDASEDAQKFSAGILEPIYKLAENIEFPAFHWVAFALMVSGVVSFALQLVLGKLVVLMRAGFDLAEILMDAQSLLISLVGLILTTQAAAQNSTFTQSPAAVLSSAAVGVLVGFIFYLWGQSKELQALRGRRAENLAKRD